MTGTHIASGRSDGLQKLAVLKVGNAEQLHAQMCPERLHHHHLSLIASNRNHRPIYLCPGLQKLAVIMVGKAEQRHAQMWPEWLQHLSLFYFFRPIKPQTYQSEHTQETGMQIASSRST